jgi:mannose-6-phosphate isomerase-like protein (cupin superfamily)
MTAPIVHEPGGGETAAVGALSFSIKAGAEQTQGAYSRVEADGPSFATAHVHHDREEAFFVVEGKVLFLVGEQRVEAEPGAFLLVPRETMHGFRSQGDARLIIIHSPAGFERFFRATAEAINSGQFDLAFRDRLAAECGVTYYDDISV